MSDLRLVTCIVVACLLTTSAPAAESKKPSLQQRVAKFEAKYPTPEKIGRRLEEWTKAEPDNAEPYVMAANAYRNCASRISITSDTQAKGFAMLVDPKTKKPVGTMSAGSDPKLLRLALATLVTAAQKFPDRLDIHIGRMTLAEELNDVPAIREAGEIMLKYVAANPAKLQWIDVDAGNDPVPVKMAGQIHTHISRLYQRQKEDSDTAAWALALEALKISPKDARLLNDAAIYHAYHKQWDKALEYFVQAGQADPEDFLVQHNIAQTHLNLGHKDEARRLWKAIVAKAPAKSEDATAAADALKEMDKPKN